MLLPSVITLAYFVVLAGWAPAVQQATYVVGKTIQFGFPLVWVVIVLREPLRWSGPVRRGLLLSLGFGLLVALAMLGLYHLVLKPAGFFDGPAEMVRAKILDLGLETLAKYAAVGVFYAICHSLLEEYYWRWFVFGRLREHAGVNGAILISSLGFMAHHVILLATYFGWLSPATYLFSAAVAVGGAVWAWLYQRSGSLYGPWLSHCLVDAAIFVLGYDLARDLFAG
jgi:membrane protease YdiL (CAAX protease family)